MHNLNPCRKASGLLIAGLLSISALSFPALSGAADALSPDALVRQITADVLETIKSDKDLQSGDRARALELAEQKILPHVDFGEATRLAVGRSWSTATPEQKKRLVDEFRALLVRTYANAVDVYRGQTMKVQPVRMAAGASEVTVRNLYVNASGQSIPVDYAMLKTPEGWKVYDVSVEGMSLVITYRGEFDQIVRQSGIDGLIARLAEKNRPAAKS